MLRKLLVLATVALLAGGAGFAFASGLGPLPGEASESASSFPTATPAGGGTATPDGGGSSGSNATATPTADGGSDGTTTPVEQPFAVTIDRVEECGTTCRDVTVSLTNRQSEPATGVTVYTRVFAGNSTAEEDVVWRGSEDVGRLGAGETPTATKRVELSYSGAYAVQQADGWVTIQTTIQTDDHTITFSERKQVG